MASHRAHRDRRTTQIGTTGRRASISHARPTAAGKAAVRRYWSRHVTETSNALDLESGVFTKSSPRAIALSLKQSADTSTRRKGGAYQSAMSMLNFYINRAGQNLSPKRRQVLERAKQELRKAFGRK